MPSKSEGERRLMAGCSKNPSKMRKCPPKKVADEFFAADKAKARSKKKSK